MIHTHPGLSLSSLVNVQQQETHPSIYRGERKDVGREKDVRVELRNYVLGRACAGPVWVGEKWVAHTHTDRQETLWSAERSVQVRR